MYRRKVINVDLQKVFVRPLHEDVSVHLDKELYKPTGILEILPFNLSIDILLDANQDYHLVLKADLTLTLSDARTCKPVSYPVHLDFEEKIAEDSEICGRFLENSQNTLDILSILWENIVLEIPISYTESDELNLKEEGYQVNGNESGENIDPRLAPLLELLDKEKE